MGIMEGAPGLLADRSFVFLRGFINQTFLVKHQYFITFHCSSF